LSFHSLFLWYVNSIKQKEHNVRFTVTREAYPPKEARAKHFGGKPVKYKVLVPLTEIYEGQRKFVPWYYPFGNEALEPHTLTAHWGLFPDLLPSAAPRRIAELAFPEVKTISLDYHPNDLPPFAWYLAEEHWSNEIKDVQLDKLPKEWKYQKTNDKWSHANWYV
jgi:hypothetical protein